MVAGIYTNENKYCRFKLGIYTVDSGITEEVLLIHTTNK